MIKSITLCIIIARQTAGVHRGILPTLPTMIASGRHRMQPDKWRSAGIRNIGSGLETSIFNPSLYLQFENTRDPDH
jgi:hypothetical protein